MWPQVGLRSGSGRRFGGPSKSRDDLSVSVQRPAPGAIPVSEVHTTDPGAIIGEGKEGHRGRGVCRHGRQGGIGGAGIVAARQGSARVSIEERLRPIRDRGRRIVLQNNLDSKALHRAAAVVVEAARAIGTSLSLKVRIAQGHTEGHGDSPGAHGDLSTRRSVVPLRRNPRHPPCLTVHPAYRNVVKSPHPSVSGRSSEISTGNSTD
jgi:hypothetical protein